MAAACEGLPPVSDNKSGQECELEAAGMTPRVPARNIRLAVCMVGGTSLAIYENGVAQEMFRLVHGQGVYGLLKRLTHSHAFIDILSGTSAGGMNTVMLSAALANGSDFRNTHDLWVNLTSIDKLLQDPKDTRVTSLMQGNTYDLKQLETVFAGLTQPNPLWSRGWIKPGVPSGSPGDKARCTDIDLFVTGTYFEGQPRAYYDSRTRPIFTHDYAGVFTLRHRARWGESHFRPDLKDSASTVFAPSGPGATPGSATRVDAVGKRLARVARTTSSLPAVFEPSEVDASLMNGVIPLLRTETAAGSETARNGGERNYIMDGGFLNNMPLDLVVKGIVNSPTSRETLRKVFFIEPEPESLGSAPPEPFKPNAVQNVLFWRDVPTRQSLCAALRMVEEHNERASRVASTLDAVRRMIDDNYRPTPAQHNLWVEVCLHDLRDQLIDIWNKALGLEGFGGVEILGFQDVKAGEDKARACYEEQRNRAQTLRAIRTRLYARMRDACWDLVDESASSTKTTPPPCNPGATWRLAEVDTASLSRMIMRAIDEVYALLYPGTDRGAAYPDENVVGDQMLATRTAQQLGISNQSPPSTQVWRQLVYEALTGNGDDTEIYRKLRAYMHQLYALRDAVDIIGGGLAQLMENFVTTPVYQDLETALTKQTPPQELNGLTEALWNLLEGCLEEFLSFATATRSEGGGTANEAAALLDVDRYEKLLKAVTSMDETGTPQVEPGADVFADFQTAWSKRVREFQRRFTDEETIKKATLTAWQQRGAARIQPGQPEQRSESTILVKILRQATNILSEIVKIVNPLVEDTAQTGIAKAATTDESPAAEKVPPCKKQSVPLAWIASYARDLKPEGEKSFAQGGTLSQEQNGHPADTSESAVDAGANRPPNSTSDNRLNTETGSESEPIPALARAVEMGLRDLDILMYPYERAANLPTRDRISLVHISPRDVQIGLSRGNAEDKLAGDALFNFGGFLKRSWRVNDILWGRLDASGGMAQTLLDRDRLTRILAADAASATNMMNALDDYVLRGDVCGSTPKDRQTEATDDTGLFLKTWYQARRGKIERWLRAESQDAPLQSAGASGIVLQEGNAPAANAPQNSAQARGYAAPPPQTNAAMEDGFNDLLEVTLMRHQIEILMEEVPDAVAQAIAEHAQWEGRCDASLLDPVLKEHNPAAAIPPEDPPAPAVPLRDADAHTQAQRLVPAFGFQPDDPTCDALQAQAQRLTAQMFAANNNAAPANTPQTQAGRVYAYFRTRYAIGQENVGDDIPALVSLRRLIGMLLVALHVLQNCLNGTDAQPAKKNPLTTLLTRGLLTPLSLVVGAMYGFMTLLAQSNAVAIATHAIVWSLVVFGIVALAFGWIKATTLVMVVVAAAVGFEALYWWTRSLRQRSRNQPGWLLVASLAVLLVAAIGYAQVFFPGIGSGMASGRGTLTYPPLVIASVHPGLAWGLWLAATLLLMAILTAIGFPLQTSQAPKGIVSFELAGSARAQSVLNSWDDRARKSAAASLLVDFFFIPLYTTTIGFACAWAAQAAQQFTRLHPQKADWLAYLAAAGCILAWAQWVAGALDVGENICLLLTLRGPLAKRSQTANSPRPPKTGAAFWWPQLAAWCAKGKFILVGIGLLYALLLFALLQIVVHK